MEPWQEPVRGAPLPPAAYALPGLDRLRGYGRRLWPNTPMHHLLGFRTTQAANGSAVASMPITPWLAHPDGFLDVAMILDAVCSLAAGTTIPAGATAVPFSVVVAPLRHLDPETRTMVGRAHVVRTTPDWAYVEGTVEDGDGRVAASGGAHVTIRAVDFPIPDDPLPNEPIDHPRYPTADPFERPLPVEKHRVIQEFHERGIMEVFPEIIAGHAPLPPVYELIGIRPVEIAAGQVVTKLTTSPWLTSFDANVTPVFIGTFGLDAAGATMWTLSPPGFAASYMQWSTTYVEAVPADGRALTARCRGEKLADDVIRAVTEVYDGERRVALVTADARLATAPTYAKVGTSRVLSTVLFTDVVDSTRQAERLGDTEWHETLLRHHKLVESEVAHHGGRVVKWTGDGVLATFDTPTAAVRCARTIRDAVGRLGIRIRAGVHTGECEVAEGDVAGLAVHTAARIERTAGPGEVWVSETTRALVSGPGLAFVDQGEHDLKGLDEPLRLFRVD